MVYRAAERETDRGAARGRDGGNKDDGGGFHSVTLS
jgi:hypothetical protein